MGRKKKDYTAAIDSLNPDIDADSEDMSLEDMGFDQEDAVDVSKKDDAADVDAPTSEAPSDATDTAETPETASEGSPDETPDEAPVGPLDPSGESSGAGASEDAAKKPDDASSAELSPSTDAATPADGATASTPSPEKAEDAADEAEPAVGSPEGLEAAEKAAEDAPKPVDPATLPGMAPCATVGAIEAVSGQPAPMTAIEGLGKDDSVPALGEVHEAAKPIEDALDGEVLGQLKDAGDKVSDAMLQLKALEQDLDSLPEGARAIAVKVMSMGLHFVSALESVFKRQ